MNDIVFNPFGVQKKILNSNARVIGAFAGKRGGKTEVGAIKSILYQEQKRGHSKDSIDPYIGVIIAPTTDMLRRLSLKKFLLYAKTFVSNFNKQQNEITWHDGSIIYGLSADRPERLEGIKAGWIWIDEVFQTKEQLFLECKARVSDTKGFILCTGSLGVQYNNPKMHWAYNYFKLRPTKETECYEWSTLNNPYFPKDELEDLKDNLDPTTFRQMFELDWDTTPKTAVYHDFDDANIIRNYRYDPRIETYISIDWGWAHPMACLFIQYDRRTDSVYFFDEIVGSKITIEELYNRIVSRPYNINGWVCDVAGNQEREQTGWSNIEWFRKKGVKFKTRRTAIQYGIPIVRKYIRDGMNRAKLFVDETRCPKLIDGFKMYKYPEKDGVVTNENPVKENDDCMDALRYFFVNILDKNVGQGVTITLS